MRTVDVGLSDTYNQLECGARPGQPSRQMIAFLLFCILLCLCEPLRTFTAFMFWIAMLLLVWNWPSAANDLRGAA